METENEVIDIIKKKLENYEEEYVSGAWENFASKQKKKKRIILLKWGTGIAASLLLGWLTFHYIMLNNTINTPERKITTIEKNINIENEKSTAIINNNNTLDSAGRSLKTKSTSSDLKSFAETPVIISESKDGFNINNYVDSPDSNRNISDAAVLTESSGKITDTLKLAYETNKEEDSLKSNLAMYPEDFYSEDENKHDESVEKRKIRFGISLSPGVNFTETSSSLSFSGGLNTSFRLYRNFELSTGILLEQQSVKNYTKNPDVPSDKSRASLLNFDLPINVTWKFFSNRSKSYYISSGISSLAYLNENYENTTYTQEIREVFTMSGGQESIGYELVTVESNTRNTVPSFQTFDIAGRLNIILGLEQHLTNKIRLHVEPYLRIPVTEMAAENLKFTTSGITCKISF